MSLPSNGRLGGSGSGQPSSASPSLSATDGLRASKRTKNNTGFDKTKASGSIDMDLRMGRMGASYMHNPAFGGRPAPNNTPSHLPSEDDHDVAHGHMKKAHGAKTTDEKRYHVFRALTALNKAKRKGR